MLCTRGARGLGSICTQSFHTWVQHPRDTHVWQVALDVNMLRGERLGGEDRTEPRMERDESATLLKVAAPIDLFLLSPQTVAAARIKACVVNTEMYDNNY